MSGTDIDITVRLEMLFNGNSCISNLDFPDFPVLYHIY